MELKTDVFKYSENIGKGFDQIPIFLENKLGMNLKCPNCSNKQRFQMFLNVELMSINTVLDQKSQVWRIEVPNLGVLKIKDIKCLSCGFKQTEKDFINYEQEK